MIEPINLYYEAQHIIDGLEVISDAKARGVIHLAYYATYHLLAQKLGFNTVGNNGIRHGEISSILRSTQNLDPEVQEGRRVFNNLKLLRCRSDYNLNLEVTKEDAFDALDWAESVFSHQIRKAAKASA